METNELRKAKYAIAIAELELMQMISKFNLTGDERAVFLDGVHKLQAAWVVLNEHKSK